MINLRNCEFGFKCTVNWDELTPSDDKFVRHCGSCEKNVYYISEPEEMMEAIKLNRCVAINDDSKMHVLMGKIASYTD